MLFNSSLKNYERSNILKSTENKFAPKILLVMVMSHLLTAIAMTLKALKNNDKRFVQFPCVVYSIWKRPLTCKISGAINGSHI